MEKVSFGLLTGNDNADNVISSIVDQKIPNYEIIVVGPPTFKSMYSNVILISSNELEKKEWVTRKKNKVIQHASGSIVVIMKDYVFLQDNWYNGLLQFSKENNWDICINALVNDKDTRCLDWVWEGSFQHGGKGRNIDYSITNHSKMYVPGAIVIAKKYVFEICKFDESLIGLKKGSDIIWSRNALKQFNYKFNKHSKCLLNGIQGHRFKKCRRLCVCNECCCKSYTNTVINFDENKNNIILIGNGCNLLNFNYENTIDSFDNVVRFNRFTLENFTKYVGNKTTTIFTNDTIIRKDTKKSFSRYDEFNNISNIIVYNVKSSDFNTNYKSFYNIKHQLWSSLQQKVNYSKKQFFS